MKIINTNMFLPENIDYGLMKQKKDGEHIVPQPFGLVFLGVKQSIGMLRIKVYRKNLMQVLVVLQVLGQLHR
jgi:hypothetical protein